MREDTIRLNFSLSQLPIRPTRDQTRQRILASIERCETNYGLDRSSAIPGENILTSYELVGIKAREEGLLRIATPAVDWLHQQIGALGYCSLVTDRDGVALDLRVTDRLYREFNNKGLRTGACWSEKTQGTSGVGTAIADKLPTEVAKKDHFFACNQKINCFAAPILGTKNEILGTFNITSLAEQLNDAWFSIACNLSLLAAARVEQSLFYESHASDWIIRLVNQPETWGSDQAVLIAFDESGRILGMSRSLSSQLPSNAITSSLNIEDILDVSFDQLRRYAFANPGTPLVVRDRDCFRVLSAHIKAPRTKDKVLRKEPLHFAKLAEFTTSDTKMSENVARLKCLANKKIPILLLGETGAGKEQTARSIHQYSNRASKPFVAINCAAIPESLIESELFGYKGGAFTGANASGCAGKIAQANGGTLFLDEIGDMPLALQTRLLRVLSEGELLALGATTPDLVDLSVICATHRDLPSMVKEKSFREDLFYRLNAATFKIPPLREREDISDIIAHVFSEEQSAISVCKTLSYEVNKKLCEHSWPGNFRELRNILRYALAVCDGEEIAVKHLPESFGYSISKAIISEPVISKQKIDTTVSFVPKSDTTASQTEESDTTALPKPRCDQIMFSAESRIKKGRDELLNSLRIANWSATAASMSLGISRATLYRRMKKFGIVTPNMLDSAAFSLPE